MPRIYRNKSAVLKPQTIRPPTNRMPTEHEEQREFVRWFRQSYPDVRIFAIPNGGARSQREGGRFKLEGVSPGVPDLFIPAWLLWIEFKRREGGRVSAEQRDWMEYLDTIGHQSFIARGAESGKEFILSIKSK
jgi:hypothetical protein